MPQSYSESTFALNITNLNLFQDFGAECARLLGFYTAAGGNPNYVNHEDLKNAMEVVVDKKPSENFPRN
jgi:hypothetical protein